MGMFNPDKEEEAAFGEMYRRAEDKRMPELSERMVTKGGGLVCRGDWLLGSACGQCDRCLETALSGAIRLRDAIRELRTQAIGVAEQNALWHWHHEQELACANKGEYDDAKWHRDRAKVFWRDPLEKSVESPS